MKNPFVYGESVTGKDFCNREEEIKKLFCDLLDSQKMFLVSSRRMGKTSLIITVLGKIKKKNIKTIYLDVEGISTYKKFLNVYLNALIKEATTTNKIYEFAKRLLPNIRFDIPVDEAGNPTLSLGYKPQDANLEDIATKIFDLPKRIATKKQMVVVFDEFQEILNLNGKQIEASLRSAIQHQRNIGYIFAGSKRHLLTDMAMSSDRPFYKIGPVMYLEKIPRDKFGKFIYEKFHKSGIKISNSTMAKIIEISENIPYYVQMLSHELWDFAVSEKREIQEKDVEIILGQLIKQYDQNFRMEWGRLVSTKKQLLQVIASKGGKNLLSKESLEENELPYPSSVQRTLESLMADDHIDKINGEYFIVNILLREWIKRFTV